MSSHIVVIDCNSGNEYDNSNINIRISSVFVILIGSTAGALLPYCLTRTKYQVSPMVLSTLKYFGSGVIIATAFIHLLAPAIESLNSPCLTGPITDYSWAEGIVLMTIFVMFLIEFVALRYEVFGSNSPDLESRTFSPNPSYGKEERAKHFRVPHDQPSPGASEQRLSQPVVLENPDNFSRENVEVQTSITNSQIPEDEATNNRSPGDPNFTLDNSRFSVQLTTLFILEFGIIFHSIFIGLTLAVTPNDEFNILYIVLLFHQTFEGLGLGSRLASIHWPKSDSWMPWVLALAFGLTTPIAISIGLALHSTLILESQITLIVNGVFDSISAGILMYTGLVELLAHEFLFNQEMRKASVGTVVFALSSMCSGATLMALLGKWA